MPEPEFNVICPSCGSEVSPYVTECPYCGNRLRKRAPDLKKEKKALEKEERREAKKRERLRAQYEGGGSSANWYDAPSDRPVATMVLVGIAVVASVIAASGISGVSVWMTENLIFARFFAPVTEHPWTLVSSPFLQGTFGYGFVCLFTAAVFGAGIERRYGAIWTTAVWVFCGALGVAAEALLARSAISFGAYAIAVGFVLAWTIVVVNREDLRDYDTLGLAAFGFVLCLLPIATDEARIWTLLGGIIGGLICGAVLTRVRQR
ncbi:MAG TPA: rhomboid family intramembrane serine protease [Rudaea sp.]|nr:rhomboid family intramembrane serine protease [Rudaea sp.]